MIKLTSWGLTNRSTTTFLDRSKLKRNPTLILYLFSNRRHIRVGFCLSLDLSRTVAVDRFVRPQLVSLIIHPQYSRLCSFLFLLVSSIRRQGLAFVVRSIVQRTVDNQRRSGAAIAGF